MSSLYKCHCHCLNWPLLASHRAKLQVLFITIHAFKTSTSWRTLKLQSKTASTEDLEFYAMSMT